MSKRQPKLNPHGNSTEPSPRPQFAPGPWLIVEDRLVYSIGCNRFVADCEFGHLPPHDPLVEEQTANARLIATAPELYSALENLLRLCGPSSDIHNTLAVASARAALAKARGEVGHE